MFGWRAGLIFANQSRKATLQSNFDAKATDLSAKIKNRSKPVDERNFHVGTSKSQIVSHKNKEPKPVGRGRGADGTRILGNQFYVPKSQHSFKLPSLQLLFVRQKVST